MSTGAAAGGEEEGMVHRFWMWDLGLEWRSGIVEPWLSSFQMPFVMAAYVVEQLACGLQRLADGQMRIQTMIAAIVSNRWTPMKHTHVVSKLSMTLSSTPNNSNVDVAKRRQ